RLQLERVRASLMHQQPALGIEQEAVGRMAEAAHAVGGNHAMAGNYDRQTVVAAGLSNLARRFEIRAAQLSRHLPVGQRAPARYAAKLIPQATLEFGALDQQRQVEFRIRVLAVALELAHDALSQRVDRILGF